MSLITPKSVLLLTIILLLWGEWCLSSASESQGFSFISSADIQEQITRSRSVSNHNKSSNVHVHTTRNTYTDWSTPVIIGFGSKQITGQVELCYEENPDLNNLKYHAKVEWTIESCDWGAKRVKREGSSGERVKWSARKTLRRDLTCKICISVFV